LSSTSLSELCTHSLISQGESFMNSIPSHHIPAELKEVLETRTKINRGLDSNQWVLSIGDKFKRKAFLKLISDLRKTAHFISNTVKNMSIEIEFSLSDLKGNQRKMTCAFSSNLYSSYRFLIWQTGNSANVDSMFVIHQNLETVMKWSVVKSEVTGKDWLFQTILIPLGLEREDIWPFIQVLTCSFHTTPQDMEQAFYHPLFTYIVGAQEFPVWYTQIAKQSFCFSKVHQ